MFLSKLYYDLICLNKRTDMNTDTDTEQLIAVRARAFLVLRISYCEFLVRTIVDTVVIVRALTNPRH